MFFPVEIGMRGFIGIICVYCRVDDQTADSKHSLNREHRLVSVGSPMTFSIVCSFTSFRCTGWWGVLTVTHPVVVVAIRRDAQHRSQDLTFPIKNVFTNFCVSLKHFGPPPPPPPPPPHWRRLKRKPLITAISISLIEASLATVVMDHTMLTN